MSSEVEDMKARFRSEGLQWDVLQTEDRSLQLWRWLGDAESNLASSRAMRDKLHQEVEGYEAHLKSRWEEQASRLEAEKTECVRKLDGLERRVATLQAVLSQGGYMLPPELVHSSAYATMDALTEQVATLLARNQYSAEQPDRAKADLVDQLVQACTEREGLRTESSALKQELEQTLERIELLEKASEQLEGDNRQLALNLAEALRDLETFQKRERTALSGEESSPTSSKHQNLKKDVECLQEKLDRLRTRLHESVAKYERFKTKAKLLLLTSRKERDQQILSLSRRLESLQGESVLQEKRLQTERSLVDRLQEDHLRLQKEHTALQNRLLEAEEQRSKQIRCIQDLEWRLTNTANIPAK